MSKQPAREETPEEFFADLVDYDEAARLLGVQPQSIPPAICSGHLPLTRYRRGRKGFLSKREIVAHLKSRARPAPAQPTDAA